MPYVNFLVETLAILKKHKKTEKDIVWTGTKYEYISWNKFKKGANTKYCNDTNEYKIRPSLIIVGKDFWLERASEFNKEFWVYKEGIFQPKQKVDRNRLIKEWRENG